MALSDFCSSVVAYSPFKTDLPRFVISPFWSSCRLYAGGQVVCNQVTPTLVSASSKQCLFAAHLSFSTLLQRFICIHLLQKYLTFL